jgi:tRNA-binding EMAP/Myf-like protein
VNVGDKEVQIVTGASNVSEGEKVPAVLDEVWLPEGMRV